ncbi:MAG: hypothetical protein A2583_16090 [Bdellovibrionales bacterium RIFOXYD1_FULL_53_11]|nr:MAG: hypothetical protein A2583_16090 [Bdellovibrionales bacterium RIFOXYD1_FULL_53_11]
MMEKKMRGSSKKLYLVFVAIAFLTLFACGSAPKKDAAELSSPVAVSPVKDIGAALSAEEAVNGSVVLLKIVAPDSAGEASVEYEGRELPVFPLSNGETVSLVPVPFDRKPGPSVVKVRFGDITEIKIHEIPLRVLDGGYPSEVLRVDPKQIKPPKKYIKRIMRESREIGALYRRITPAVLWNGPFRMPIQSAITSSYGTRRVYNGEVNGFHQGVDLKAARGTPVRASAGGVVAMAKNLYFTGWTVILDHGYGIFTVYGHMNKLKVRRGAKVKAGQLVGLSGMTGRSSGPHLHWGVVVSRVKINPLEFMKVVK